MVYDPTPTLLADGSAYRPSPIEGELNKRPAWHIPRRRLPYYVLVHVFRGHEEIIVEDEAMSIRPGTTYLIQPEQVHDLRSARGSTLGWLHFTVRGDSRRRSQPLPPAVWGCSLPTILPTDIDFATLIQRIFQDLASGTPEGRWSARHGLEGLLLDVVLAQRALQCQPETDYQRIRRVEDWARQRIEAGIVAGDLADEAGMGRSSFFALYQRLRGHGPGHFLTRVRLERACSLLQNSESTLSTVAGLSGFADAASLSRSFKAIHGMTPGQWRVQRR